MRPPFGDLRLAPLLAAQAEIATAADDAETARLAAAALSAIADSYPSRSLDASAALAGARAALTADDLGSAIHLAKAATAAWADIGAPYESAAARMVLGEARRRSGDSDGAHMEWRAAEAVFDSFGALHKVAQARRLVDGFPLDQPPNELVESAAATFKLHGDIRTIAFGGETALMHDLKGLRYIERLLADPGREIHALDLVAVEHGSVPSSRVIDHSDEAVAEGVGAGLPVIDDVARDAYRRRLADVDADIAEATEMNDLGRIELAQRDRDYLVAELTSAVGLGGRARSVGGSAERARSSVTRSVRYSLKRLAEHQPALAAHLEQSVQTGTYCVYNPDPLAPLTWEI
jgi:hypothetical protein